MRRLETSLLLLALAGAAQGETLRDPGYGDGSLVDSHGYSYFPQDDGTYADVYGHVYAPDDQGGLKDALGNLLQVPDDFAPSATATSGTPSKAQKRGSSSAAAAQALERIRTSRRSNPDPGNFGQVIEQPTDDTTPDLGRAESDDDPEEGTTRPQSSPTGLDLGSMYAKDTGNTYMDTGGESQSDFEIVGPEAFMGEANSLDPGGLDPDSYGAPFSQPAAATDRFFNGEPSQDESPSMQKAWSRRIHKDDLFPKEDLSPATVDHRDERISP